MIAESAAGMVEHMTMFPVDTIKTQMQALVLPIKFASVKQVVHSIQKYDSASGFYSWIGAMALGARPAHTSYLSVYGICKKSFYQKM